MLSAIPDKAEFRSGGSVCVWGGEGCFILSDWSALCQVTLFGNTRQPEESEVEW